MHKKLILRDDGLVLNVVRAKDDYQPRRGELVDAPDEPVSPRDAIDAGEVKPRPDRPVRWDGTRWVDK